MLATVTPAVACSCKPFDQVVPLSDGAFIGRYVASADSEGKVNHDPDAVGLRHHVFEVEQVIHGDIESKTIVASNAPACGFPVDIIQEWERFGLTYLLSEEGLREVNLCSFARPEQLAAHADESSYIPVSQDLTPQEALDRVLLPEEFLEQDHGQGEQTRIWQFIGVALGIAVIYFAGRRLITGSFIR